MLTVKQYAALNALLTCNSRKEAAEKAGIGIRTLQDYFRDEEFCREYDSMFSSLIDEATKELVKSLPVAIHTLRSICEDEEASIPARSAAAFRILDAAPRYLEANEIITRIERLERKEKQK